MKILLSQIKLLLLKIYPQMKMKQSQISHMEKDIDRHKLKSQNNMINLPLRFGSSKSLDSSKKQGRLLIPKISTRFQLGLYATSRCLQRRPKKLESDSRI